MAKKAKVAYTNAKIISKISKYAIKDLLLIFIYLTITVTTLIISVRLPLIVKDILDKYLGNTNLIREDIVNGVTKLSITYAILMCIMIVLRYINNIVFNLAAMNLELAIRNDAMEKIDLLPVDYYSLEPDGKIVAKITNDTAGVRQFYAVLFSIVQSIINLVIVYIAIFSLNKELALYTLLASPIILLWITVFRKKINKFTSKIRELGSRITGKLNEFISGVLIIQAFNQEENMLKDYQVLINDYMNNERKLNKMTTFFGWELLQIIKRFLEVGIIAFFGYLILGSPEAGITAGLIYAYFEYINRIMHPINQIFNNLNELEDSLVAANRVFVFLDEKNDLYLEGKKAPDTISGKVEFKNIQFSYTKEMQVLNDVSLTVDAGKTIGIVGHTGSGKSTLMNLLVRFNDHEIGDIYVDDEEIRQFDKRSYRKNIGIILQTPAIFAGTIKSNIAMEREYSDEEVLKVIEQVGASYMIEKHPLGLYTPITFKGDNLSLGEKQLISFARILLRNPKILILDEATANIDSETELRIKEAMQVLTQNRTTFIIAHRLSTVKEANEIIVFDHGKIIGKGSHMNLYNECLIYKDMYDAQYQE